MHTRITARPSIFSLIPYRKVGSDYTRNVGSFEVTLLSGKALPFGEDRFCLMDVLEESIQTKSPKIEIRNEVHLEFLEKFMDITFKIRSDNFGTRHFNLVDELKSESYFILNQDIFNFFDLSWDQKLKRDSRPNKSLTGMGFDLTMYAQGVVANMKQNHTYGELKISLSYLREILLVSEKQTSKIAYKIRNDVIPKIESQNQIDHEFNINADTKFLVITRREDSL